MYKFLLEILQFHSTIVPLLQKLSIWCLQYLSKWLPSRLLKFIFDVFSSQLFSTNFQFKLSNKLTQNLFSLEFFSAYVSKTKRSEREKKNRLLCFFTFGAGLLSWPQPPLWKRVLEFYFVFNYSTKSSFLNLADDLFLLLRPVKDHSFRVQTNI